MAQTTILNGVSYSIPDPGDTGWGAGLTAFLVAVSPAVLQKSGGTFTLTADTDFGSSFGLKSAYFSTRNANPASTGIVRLSNTDAIAFRNFANSGNLALTVNASDALLFNGSPVGQFVSTIDRAVITNGSGTLAVSPTTATEIAFVSGVTSAIQTQLDAKELLTNKSINTSLGTSDTLYPTQNAVKTYVDTNSAPIAFASYRRPNLTFVSVTTVDVENNTGTVNETKIVFPDGSARLVTENTSSTSKYRRFIITETAEFTSGTENSGLRSGLSETANTWYAIYAVKSQINAANFVLVGDTTLPIQANFSTLNSAYGTNSWLYLGVIRNGDNSGATTDILSFEQSGSQVAFKNNTTLSSLASQGLTLAISGATTVALTYSYSAGTGATNIPNNITIGTFMAGTGSGPITVHYRAASFETIGYISYPSAGGITLMQFANYPLLKGIQIASGETVERFIVLTGFHDSVLAAGINPTL